MTAPYRPAHEDVDAVPRRQTFANLALSSIEATTLEWDLAPSVSAEAITLFEIEAAEAEDEEDEDVED